MNELIKIMDGSIDSVDKTFSAIKFVENLVNDRKAQEKELASERKNLELALEDAKTFIKEYMLTNGLAELEGSVVKYSISRSNPKLIIEDESLIPKIYKEETITTTIRKDAIKDQLKMGDDIPGCKIEDSFALKVNLK